MLLTLSLTIPLLGTIKPANQFTNVSVQLERVLSDKIRDAALKYLNDYTKNMFKVSVYWGDASKFAEELRCRMINID